MGSWTSISIGNLEVLHFKNIIPSFAILLFDESDLKKDYTYHGLKPNEINFDDYDDDINSIEDLDEFKETNYWFESSVRKVRQILTNRGIDEAFCRELFEALKLRLVWIYTDDGDEGEYPNLIDYDIYKTLLTKKYFENQDLDSDDELKKYKPFADRLFDSEFPELFWDENIYEFEDAWAILKLRPLIDLAPDNDTVRLPLFSPDVGEISYQSFIDVMRRKVEFDYKVYGFVIHNDPNVDIRLRAKIERLDEDLFINQVLIPLMKAMKFSDVKPVTTHGHGEFGKDIMPFRRTTEFNTIRYLALQAKAVQIHGSAGKNGNAGELLSQAINGFKVAFFDGVDNERKRIDEFIIATNKGISAEAKRTIEEGIEGDRKITFLDIERIVELVKKYELTEYILFSVVENE